MEVYLGLKNAYPGDADLDLYEDDGTSTDAEYDAMLRDAGDFIEFVGPEDSWIPKFIQEQGFGWYENYPIRLQIFASWAPTQQVWTDEDANFDELVAEHMGDSVQRVQIDNVPTVSPERAEGPAPVDLEKYNPASVDE